MPIKCEHDIYISGPIKCVIDLNCPDQLACGEGECVEPPCPECAVNAHCEEPSNHTRTCTCDTGFLGDPYIAGCAEGNMMSHNYQFYFCT